VLVEIQPRPANGEVVLTLEDGEEAYWTRLSRASLQWRSGPRPGGWRGRLLDEVKKSLCWWGISFGQPLHNGEVVLALEDGEEDYWMRLSRACAGEEPASASLSTVEKWSSPLRTEREVTAPSAAKAAS
jgi:hypothetical protein